MPRLTENATRALQTYGWPGNVRELQNALEHAVVLLEPGQSVEAGDIPLHGGARPDGGSAHAAAEGTGENLLQESYHVARENVIAQFERRYLSELVRAADGNMSKAARLAGVDRTTLYRLMERHGMQRDDVATNRS